MPKERLQKILARAGVASRRAAETLITTGHVRVNGRIVTELGSSADATRDRVELDGVRVVIEKPAYYVLNKPREVVTTLKDPEGRPSIGDLLKRIPERVFPVGRLDFHTSGVLLLTNDGAMAQALLHPTRGVPKTYVVKVKGHLGVPQLDRLRNGVVLDGGEQTGKAELFVLREEGPNSWLQITITEGKNRQIHRMMEAIGYRVQRLSRLAFAGVTAEGLRPGEHRPLTSRELMKLERDYLTPSKRKQVAEKRKRRHQEHELGFGQMGEAWPPSRPPSMLPKPFERAPRAERAGRAGRAGPKKAEPKRGGAQSERFDRTRRNERPDRSPDATRRGPAPKKRPPSRTRRHESRG